MSEHRFQLEKGCIITKFGIRASSSDSMREHCEGSGFRQFSGLGGSGRMLALRHRVCEKEISITEDSREGCYVESRGGEKRSDIDSIGIGLLEGQREIQIEGRMVEFISESGKQSTVGSISSRKVLSARFVGFRRMCDLEVRHESHNYALANGIMSCNSHAVTYGAITTVELWLKHHFPIQYITALLSNTKLGAKKLGSSNLLGDYISYARRREIAVLGPDINKSGETFRVEGDAIRFALGRIKNVAKAAKIIESFQPFTSMQDFYDRVKIESKDDVVDEKIEESDVIVEDAKSSDMESNTEVDVEEVEEKEVIDLLPVKKSTARRPNRKVVEHLIASGAFDCFGTRNEMAMAYWRLRRKSSKKDKLKAKLLLAEDKERVAAENLLKIQSGGDEKEIKKAVKEVVRAKAAVEKAKEAIVRDNKTDEAIAASSDANKIRKNDDEPPEDKTEEEWQAAETEVIGMCLSRPILYKQYEDMIRKEGWYLINEIDPSKKKILVFGQIVEIKQHISKAGNSMRIVYITDGIDSMRFFVFQGGWESFKDHFRVGTIGVIPLARFEDGDGGTRFFDDRSKHVILKKE